MFDFGRKKKAVTIFGSCVSRDIFEYIQSDKFEIEQYFARTKIVSQLSSPVNVLDEELELLSNFQKRMVLNDLNKQQFHMLEKKRGGFCVIDFIDERFHLIKIGDTYITKSNELVSSGWLKDKEYIEDQYRFENSEWELAGGGKIEKYLKMYLDNISYCFKKNQIILHKAYMVDHYIDKNGERKSFDSHYLLNNFRINAMLDFLYGYTEKYIKKIKIIDLCEKYDADEKHKWGLSTMHYQQTYYIEAAKLIKEYMKL